MSNLKTYPLQNSAILRINSEREDIKVDPEYQRQGEVWDLSKKQLLIDSILNDYDIPKLYFHHLQGWYEQDFDQDKYRYSVIDGRQRLETIWEFVDGKFSLAKDFKLLDNPDLDVGGATYQALAERSPRLKVRFDSFSLPIVLVETDDVDLIEDMFSRLNEAVPLNAAEKRNALGGSMAKLIRALADHRFFADKVRFGNRRYQYREVAARLLLLLMHIELDGRIVDTKKSALDEMVRSNHDGDERYLGDLLKKVEEVLNSLLDVFVDRDMLLRAQSAIPIFFIVARNLIREGTFRRSFDRKRLEEFYELVQRNRFVATFDLESASYELLEFDRLSQQGTNDASSIKFRAELLGEFLLDRRSDIEERVSYAYVRLHEEIEKGEIDPLISDSALRQ